ncbi:hypothetical protein BH09SUM1_BH09SUM1_20650 [soil metagenome]
MASSSADSAPTPRSTRERLDDKRKSSGAEEPAEQSTITGLQRMRGYIDALVVAYVLAMFIRTYVFELFMIPTGSMTPTLIGDSEGEVVFADYDSDGIKDIIYTFSGHGRSSSVLQIYLMDKDNTFRQELFVRNVNPDAVRELANHSPHRKDMILVNKFAYWFATPQRGDIAVFKVPDRPNPQTNTSVFDPTKPVFIKRVVGLPGDTVTFEPVDGEEVALNDPRRVSNAFGGIELQFQSKPVLINGEPLTTSPFQRLVHFPRPGYGNLPMPRDHSDVIEVDKQAVLMIGDNAASSLDGRYWGDVPMNHLRGKAILRYLPWPSRGFLRSHE